MNHSLYNRDCFHGIRAGLRQARQLLITRPPLDYKAAVALKWLS